MTSLPVPALSTSFLNQISKQCVALNLNASNLEDDRESVTSPFDRLKRERFSLQSLGFLGVFG